jgi:arginine decarboxylase
VRIVITKGIGEGPTPIAAFDAALMAAGVANYNLISLSSIIPPGSTVVRARYLTPPDEYGHRLYMVIARAEAIEPGQEIWAGIGWTQERADGRGLFVELHGCEQGQVVEALDQSLRAMIEGRGRAYGPIEYELAGAVCEGRPVCALVIAIYQSQGWA